MEKFIESRKDRIERVERAKDENAEGSTCIFAFSAISHGYIRDLWPDFDSISRRGLFTYWHPEYVLWLMLHLDLYCSDAITQIYLPRYIEMRWAGSRWSRATRNSDVPPKLI